MRGLLRFVKSVFISPGDNREESNIFETVAAVPLSEFKLMCSSQRASVNFKVKIEPYCDVWCAFLLHLESLSQ